ncbi:helix-turn-helix transcriptional regulator [Streptococcus uberis]|uniref:helix-turn-helix domain-containing protein n=1 Tax=Streptococcus uberis TaxID=1349 RepID=UPI0018E106D9|nr:helix-turn-helix transcriptional regulator [Streptococcus uberis]MBI0908000.1 helix-turn-helix transcriptional regulator [Streptococcus uberis]
MKINKEAVSERLRQIRINKNLTMEEWGAILGIAKSSISRWENGTIPHPRTLKKIAEISNVDINYILYGTITDYIISFLKQFPLTFELLDETRDFFYDLTTYMNNNYYSYGDDDKIVDYILTNYPAYSTILENELISYDNVHELVINELRHYNVEDNPIYRLHYLEKIDELFLLLQKRKNNDISVKNQNNFTGLKLALTLLIQIEKLSEREFQPTIRKEANETKKQLDQYINNIFTDYDSYFNSKNR